MSNKIINIRGTSGSGKTTLVNRIMELATSKTPMMKEKRKRPLGYLLVLPTGEKLTVLGHYETACGGCDTLPDFDTVFALVREHAANGHVLFEGLLLNSDFERTKALGDVDVIFLNTTIDECVASINARRAARGVMEGVKPENTAGKHRCAEGQLKKFKEGRAPLARAYSLNREDAFNKVRELLGV